MNTLLVIDDDRLNCDLFEAVFGRQGYRILTATSGREGLDLFRRCRPNATLLDLRMQGMDGLAVLKEIRAHDPSAGVIVLGGGATDDQENQARELSVTDFFRKGLSLDVLIDAVNRIARHGLERVGGPGLTSQANASLNETVLIVDDDTLVRDLLARFLELRGYRVRTTHSGSEAVVVAAESKPDLILLDLVMPEMSGLDVLRALREQEYAGGIIVLTGNYNERLVEEAWSMAPQELLGKPVDLERLLTAVQLVMVCREC
jgi:DNA-binding response OmpR family regulator